MKKILGLLVILSLFAIPADAQVQFQKTAYNPTGAITDTNVDTSSIVLTRGYRSVAIQPIITRATGTMAGTAILACSSTGTAGSWVNTDTLTLTNAATSTPTIWTKTQPVKYWRVIRSGGTTVTGSTKVYLTPGQ